MNYLNPTIGSRTSLAISGFTTLAAGNYAVSNACVCNTNKPIDVVVEVEAATTNVPSGNKCVHVFLKETLDGSNYRSGPETGAVTTDEKDLLYLGPLFLNSQTNVHRASFNIVQFLGYVPYGFKVVVKNDVGVALTTGNLFTTEIAGVIA
jgi:hypothetical protein